LVISSNSAPLTAVRSRVVLLDDRVSSMPPRLPAVQSDYGTAKPGYDRDGEDLNRRRTDG
jgi:hypothetical protein